MSVPNDTRGARRLVVLDDDPALGKFVAEVGRRIGFETRVTTTAEGFARELETIAVVVVVDLMVPGTDGVEVLRGLADRGGCPEVILMSGLDERVIESASRAAAEFGLHVRGRLHKPFRAAALRTLLEQVETGLLGGTAGTPSADDLPPIDHDDIWRACHDGQLGLQYQPEISLSTGAWVGAEALVRWRHPQRGLVMPADFLPLVDTELLATELTIAVLRMAAADWAEVRQRTGLPVRLSVNIHPLALTDPAFLALTLDALEGHGLKTSDVVLEMTEVAEVTRGLDLSTMTRLRMRGFGLSIDDFGIGHSSLERLNRMPFTELKIDRSFVSEIETNNWARTIAAQSIALAGALGLRSVAEGIESEVILAWLRDSGCDLAQGYLIAKPMWPDELDAWAERWGRSSAAEICRGKAEPQVGGLANIRVARSSRFSAAG
jgi:EAL domain-containing protein (putative c-di-GMP-specific phosphodiesterase class I)